MLPHFHSVSVIKTSPWLGPDTVIATDACLKGCGGTFQNSYFSYKFSQEILDSVHGINKLEALAVTLALKLWGKDLRGLRFMLNCDNLVTVTIINSGRAKDPFLQACAREIAFLACKYEFEVHATHIAGVENRLPDLLSRACLNIKYMDQFHLDTDNSWSQEVISSVLWKFSCPW